MTPLLSLVRTLRFRLWALALRARLRRAGGRLVLEAPGGTPRFHALPHVEVERLGGAGGTLTLILGRDCKLGRDLVLEVWAGADNGWSSAIGPRWSPGAGSSCRAEPSCW